MALAPDPFDDDVDRLLADPSFTAELNELRERRQRGDLDWHEDEEARAILRRHGAPIIGDENNQGTIDAP